MHRGVVIRVGEDGVYDIDNFRDQAVKRKKIFANDENIAGEEVFQKQNTRQLSLT